MKPDFSGEYVLDRATSLLNSGAAAFEGAVLRIQHREPVFRCQAEFVSSGATVEYSFERMTDGREVVVGENGNSSVGDHHPRAEVKGMATEDQAVIPMISYEDGVAALEWLVEAFGFRERARLADPEGRLMHGELDVGGGLVMLASPTPDYEAPKRHRENCERARIWSSVPWIVDGVLVHVDDLDAHFERARSAGATILSEIEEGPPGRRYRAEDLEGHRWFFVERERGTA